jgi:hypothetical protein
MDSYSKLVLTVIAIMLTVIVAREIPVFQPALAQSGLYKGGTIAVTIRGIDECLACGWQPLPVTVK